MRIFQYKEVSHCENLNFCFRAVDKDNWILPKREYRLAAPNTLILEIK